MEPQAYTFHTLPAVFMLETQLPENMVGGLAFSYGRNSLLDKERLAPPQSFIIKPEVGKMLMFPSWLTHMVYPFEGDGERRTVAANLNVWKVEEDGTRH